MIMVLKIFNKLILNLMYKKKFFKTKINNKELNLIKFLIKLNFIKFLKKINNNNFIVFLNNNNSFILKKITKKKNFIKLSEIKKLNKNYKNYIISTSFGIMSSKECLKKKLGGLLIYKLILK